MIDISNASRDALSRAWATAPPHYKPLIAAVRDMGCGYAFVLQAAGPFTLPLDRGKPAIILIGDDLMTAKGPAGFDRASVERVARECEAAFVIASAPEEKIYGAASSVAAAQRRHVLIVETLPPHDGAWADLIRDANPSIRMVMSKVNPLARPAVQPWGRA